MTRHFLLSMNRFLRAGMLLASLLPFLSGTARADTPPPQNVAQLSASALVEVAQDWLSLSLTTTREAPDASTVQNQLKTALDAALTQARAAAQPGQMEVRTGNFSLFPRYGRDGRISAWQGSAELVLEGRDFARISALAGKVSTLTVGNVAFSLSREARVKLESEVQAMAIERFRQKASDVAKAFGFAGYTLREVSVSAADGSSMPPRPRMLATAKSIDSAEAALPVEAGKSSVSVSVSGAIQMR